METSGGSFVNTVMNVMFPWGGGVFRYCMSELSL
jgi:hypothetical protein